MATPQHTCASQPARTERPTFLSNRKIAGTHQQFVSMPGARSSSDPAGKYIGFEVRWEDDEKNALNSFRGYGVTVLSGAVPRADRLAVIHTDDHELLLVLANEDGSYRDAHTKAQVESSALLVGAVCRESEWLDDDQLDEDETL